MSISRRRFVQGTALSAAAYAVPQIASANLKNANEEINVGIIGLGNRGAGAHIPRFQDQSGVRVVAICDPDQKRLDATAAAFEKKYGHKVAKYTDYRKMVELPQLDVVTVATMQYNHALPTIAACAAGKHVYCEKPLSHFIWEGRQMVNAARKYDRLVQCGTQARSESRAHDSIKYLREGHLGKIKYLTAFANKPRSPIGLRSEPLPIPDDIDYELWCGPARMEPIYRDHLQYDCSFFWNTGDGESCNQGIHEIDVARWVLGETQLPRRVMSVGGRFTFNDAGNVPNAQIIYYDFPTAPVLYEVHNLRSAKGSKEMPDFFGVRTDTCVHCEGGVVLVRSGIVRDETGKIIKRFTGPESHFENFIAAVRSGKREDLHADVLEGHRSTAVTHAGNISYRLGRKATDSDIRKQVAETPLFADMWDRMAKHL